MKKMYGLVMALGSALSLNAVEILIHNDTDYDISLTWTPHKAGAYSDTIKKKSKKSLNHPLAPARLMLHVDGISTGMPLAKSGAYYKEYAVSMTNRKVDKTVLNYDLVQ